MWYKTILIARKKYLMTFFCHPEGIGFSPWLRGR